MGWIQDIVPNHMAMDSENRLLMDILENGSTSKVLSVFRRGLGLSAPASIREFWRHFLAGSWGTVSKMERSPYNTVLRASRWFTTTSPSRYESNLISNLFTNLPQLKKKLGPKTISTLSSFLDPLRLEDDFFHSMRRRSAITRKNSFSVPFGNSTIAIPVNQGIY